MRKEAPVQASQALQDAVRTENNNEEQTLPGEPEQENELEDQEMNDTSDFSLHYTTEEEEEIEGFNNNKGPKGCLVYPSVCVQ